VARQLAKCAQSNQLSHLILSGPAGSGKQLFAQLYLRHKYQLTETEYQQLNHKDQLIEMKINYKKFRLRVISSPWHLMINPSIHGTYDRHLIQDFIKNLSQSKTINLGVPYRIIIIQQAGLLSINAQQALRRTLESYIDNCRFIFLLNHDQTLIPALMSRCILFRLSAPTYEQIEHLLSKAYEVQVAPVKKLSTEDLKTIALLSERNVRTAYDLLDLSMRAFNGIEDQHDWSRLQPVELMIARIMTNPSLNNIDQIRQILYSLLIYGVAPSKIIKHILKQGIKVNILPTATLIKLANKYHRTLIQASKPMYHLEGLMMAIIALTWC
jgi:replication factor C subunit 3/5